MRSFLLPLVALTLGLQTLAEPVISPYVLHEKRAALPAGWSHLGRHDPAATIPMRFGLSQGNIDDIGELLLDVSHPKSPNYGKHWSAGKVAETFAPSPETIATVREWLMSSGIDASRLKLTASKSWFEVSLTVSEAEDLLQTEYRIYQHATGKKHVACESYYLPAHVTSHIDFVHPTVSFDTKVKRGVDTVVNAPNAIGQPGKSVVSPKTIGGEILKGILDLEDCGQYITPICLQTLYEFFYTPVAADRNSYGIVEYTPEAYLQSDLDAFFKNYSSDLVGKSPTLVSIDGGYEQMIEYSFELNGEADLDLQYAMALVTEKQEITLYQVGDIVEGASFNDFLDAIDGSYCTFEGGDDPDDPLYPDPYPGGYDGHDCGTVKPAYVISTSYGYDEGELSPFYAARQCAEYAKLGLMGVTSLFSAGDYGVAGNYGLCLQDANDNSSLTFNPSFPSTCPYVTSVGATMIPTGGNVFSREVVAAVPEIDFWSGGGFSNYFATPSYQKENVDYYMTHYAPPYPSWQWNNTGSRGYPDISANGAWYAVVVDGVWQPVFGTSCSSPVSGSMFSMINDARLAIGKGPIGFINPTIYSLEFAGAFHDIVSGSNDGCNTTGFSAAPGWDPVSGLGTPDFPVLLAKWLFL